MDKNMNNTDLKIKVDAIIVTFNRKNLVINAINGVLNQTLPINNIYIIDNCSTDGTENFIKNNFSNNKNIIYVKLKENTGSAGGFNEGVKMSYNSGSEWIWFLDDDVFPENNCLEKLLEYKNISKCIHPSKIDLNNKEFIWEYVFDVAIGKATSLKNLSFKNGKDFTFINIGCFEEMLIHRDIVSKIGYPDKRFFIAGDDTIYGFIASLYTNVIYVKNALIHKLLPISDKVSLIFLYYSTRNQFLIKEYLQKYHLFHKTLFYFYFTLFIFWSCFYYTIKNRNVLVPLYIFRGVFDGLRKKFYII